MLGKSIFIVGASSGIGYALAQLLQEQGATLYTAGRTTPAGITSTHFMWDVTQPVGDSLAGLPDVLHGLVYCPGTINLKPFHRLDASAYQTDFQINVMGAIASLQAAYPALKKAKGAGVVLFSTVASKLGMGMHSSVAVSKSAVEGLAKSLAAEFAPYSIRVNAVAPSLTDTPMASFLLSDNTKREASAKRHPLNRVGTPQDMASMAAYLLSDQASWITGQIIGVDGGMGSLK